MPLATLASVKKPLIQILNANRSAYSDTAGTGAANKSAQYPYDQEITDACLRADGHIITEGYFQSRMPLRSTFLTASSELDNGQEIPPFTGLMGKCEYSIDGIEWKPSTEAACSEDLKGASVSGAYVGENAFAGSHFIDEGEGYVYHNSPHFRIYYPVYELTTTLQAQDYHEEAIIAWALVFLYKDRSNAHFDHYKELAVGLLAAIRGGSTKLDMPAPMPAGGNQ